MDAHLGILIEAQEEIRGAVAADDCPVSLPLSFVNDEWLQKLCFLKISVKFRELHFQVAFPIGLL